MKKSSYQLACVLFLFSFFIAASSRGDGTLVFANSSSTQVMERDTYTLALTPVPTNGGKVELLYAALGTTDLGQFQTISGQSPVTIMPVAGRFFGGSYRVPGIEPGAVISAIIRGWTGDYDSWDEAVISGTAKTGISDIFLVDTGNPDTVPPEVPASIINSVPGRGFAGLILQIPEPTSLSLVLLSVGLWRIRRKV